MLALVLAGGLACATTAQAATYTVGDMGDGAGCAAPPAGACTLRQLIAYENSLGAATPNPVDTIVVPAGLVTLAAGQLTITQSLVIAGAGARQTTIDQLTAVPTSRVFGVLPNANIGLDPTVTISGMTIENGKADSTNNFFGGDILNEATLTLDHDWVQLGQTTSGSGAGIANEGGTLTVSHSLVANNGTAGAGAGASNDSGGIQNFGPNPVTGTAGTLTIDNSTIANNASNLGGGVMSWCGAGGATPCSSDGSGASNSATIVNSTIAFNNGGTRDAVGGGLVAFDGGTITVQNSIVADNTTSTGASNCTAAGPPNGVITSAGHNIDSGSDCGFNGAGDLQNTDPQFYSNPFSGTVPEDWGGDTDTLAVSATSPAVDAVPAGAAGCGGADQIGTARPQGTACDIGAYEAVQPVEGTASSIPVGPTTCGGAAPGSVTVDWGDTTTTAGSVSADGRTLLGSHAYAEEGTYSGSVTYLPSDCVQRTTQFDVKVQDAPLTVSGASFSAKPGTSFSGRLATFTDPDPNGTASDYSATIGWGDGQLSAGTVTAGSNGFSVTGTHTYASTGTFHTSITITDVGGASASATGTATVSIPPSITPAPPTVQTSTAAAFHGSVNPEGAATTAHFEYGLDPKYTGGGPVVYDQTTADRQVGSDFSNHSVTADVSGLVPNALYHVRLVAANSAGATLGRDQTFTTKEDPPPPPPILGETVNVTPVDGTVFIKFPHHNAPDMRMRRAFTKGKGFEPLTEARQIPDGSHIDARRGTLRIGAPRRRKHDGKVQKVTASGAIFSFDQSAHGLTKGLTTLKLIDGAFPGAPSHTECSAKPAAQTLAAHAARKHPRTSHKVLQTLQASDNHGQFGTSTHNSSATVRGTVWDTVDRCDGTLTIVKRGTVDVFDRGKRRTITVHAHHRYLAKAIGP